MRKDLLQIDLTPLFRSAVGFDRVARMLDAAMNLDEGQSTYPPYDIVRKENGDYQIVMALAGFAQKDISVVLHEGILTISGNAHEDPEGCTFIHRGIARRAFKRHFQLADFIKIQGASFEDGLLIVHLMVEVPEAMRPQNIAVQKGPLPARPLEPQRLSHDQS